MTLIEFQQKLTFFFKQHGWILSHCAKCNNYFFHKQSVAFTCNSIECFPSVSINGVKKTNKRNIINTQINYDVSSQLLCMINHGDYNISDLPRHCNFPLGGIRYAFHRKDLYSIYDNITQLNNIGLRIFLQPMQTSRYSKEESSYLIRLSNELKVFSVYIVDSFGSISINDLLHLTQLVSYIY